MSRKFRLVFMGTPAFAVPTLAALREAGHDIAAVYTQPPRPAGRGQKPLPSAVQGFAETYGLRVMTPHSLKSAQDQQAFAALNAEAAVVAAYGLLLPPPILSAFPLGCLNVHPSLLPRWRGAAPIQRAVMAGDRETGVCIMQMDEGLDTGGVLLMEKTELPDYMNAGELNDMLAARAGPLMLQALEGRADDSLEPQVQATDGVTYARKIAKEERRIEWSLPSEQIANLIRGLAPSPGAYFLYKGEQIKILDARHSPIEAGKEELLSAPAKPGQVIDSLLAVVCGHGMLVPYMLQRPGKAPMRTQDLLNGFPIPPGAILE